MEEIRKEKLLENSVMPVSIEITKEIINQMEKCVCKIITKGKKGTGFFTKYKYKNKINKVLITNNHVLGENEIENGETIKYIINNDEDNIKKIKIDEKRKRYTNEILDVTIIEIDEEKDNIKEYIEIDNNIMNDIEKDNEINKNEIIKDYMDVYNNESVYLLNYLNGERIKVSYGIISGINEDNGINHKCNTGNGSSGAPILSLKNNKLIGLHFGASNYDFNKGTLIIYPIIEYNKMNNKTCIIRKLNKLNELTIVYNIKNKNRINLFGNKFIQNNKENCKIIIDNKEQDIMEYLNINENMKKKEELKVKLKEIKTITHMSYMFGDNWSDYSDKLSSLPDIDKWDTVNVTNMSYMFYCCYKLTILPDISEWNTKNVKNMSYMFCNCKSLSSLPNISKWDTKNVTNMSNMFNHCQSLSSLPDISKWDTTNVIDMSEMLSSCDLLSSLPDISKWNTKNVTDMSFIFYHCKSLSSLPDISKWDTTNVINMSYMFNHCELLSSLPYISKWDTKKLTNISYMFDGCKLLSNKKNQIPLKFQ